MVSVIRDTKYTMLMYTGLQHPREFLRGVSNGDLTSDCTVVNGLDVPFTTRATRHRYRCWTDKKPVIKTATRFFTTHLDADVLQVRSMGTSYHSNKRRGSVAAILKFAFQPLQSDIVEAFNGAGKITLVMVQIPGHFADTGLRALGLQSIRNRQWFSSAVLGIATPILQEEAHQLLLDLPVPHQVVSNLAIERALRDGLISVGAATITLDRFFDRSERSTESSHRMEAGGMGVPEDRIGTPVSVHRQEALDKPTTEQIEEYRRVSHSSIRRLTRIEKDSAGNGHSSKSTPLQMLTV